MDAGLLAWARAVKRRQRNRLPVLWLFTDSARLPDPLPAIERLPAGLCGVVFRHDDAPDRTALGWRIAATCRRRKLALVVAGDSRLAARLGAGLHLRGGRRADRVRPSAAGRPSTASAHGVAELRRAVKSGAAIVFLSPGFATPSHAGAAALGAVRWCGLAQRLSAKFYCLGGVTAGRLRRLGRHCAGAGAISILVAEFH